MKDDDFDSWGKIALCLVILGMALYFGTGCATAPSMIITDADVDAKIAAIGAEIPKDPGADVYNETTGKYELTPEAHDQALGDGVIKQVQDEKIAAMNEYLAEHPPATFKTRLKHFGWDAVIVLILEAVILGAVGFSQ
jgi:hypothetical protein